MNFGMYLVIVIIALMYIYILYCGQNPKVSQEYKLYYIDNKIPNHLQAGQLLYEYGDNIIDNSEGKLNICDRGNGWGGIETDGVWTMDGISYVLFEFNEEVTDDIMLILNILGTSNEDIKVELYANDNLLETLTCSNIGENKIIIPRECISEQFLELRFETTNLRISDNDAINLGMKIHELYLDNSTY